MPVAATAGDYERNEVNGRELAVGFATWPDDLDERPAAKCPSKPTAVCSNEAFGIGPILRGAARRHRGNLYVATEAILGLRLPAGGYSAFPTLGVGGAIGWETAADSYKRLRGYFEIGAGMIYTGTAMTDLFKLHVESGLRYRVQTYERPHAYLHIAARAMSNFAHGGSALTAGVGWAFD